MKSFDQGEAGDVRAKTGLTRRSFLKTTGIALGAAGVAGAVSVPLTSLAEDYQQGQKPTDGETICRGVCRPNCFSYCHLNVHVRDGRVVKTSRGDYKDGRYSRICQRGLSHVQRIYDPQRIGYPLRRAEGTERGAGQWERISWDEAIQTAASWIKETTDKYGASAIAHYTGSNMALAGMFQFTRFAQAMGFTLLGTAVDNASSYAEARVVGGNCWESNERADILNAKNVVAWGDNLTVAQHQEWHLLKEARENGTKLVVIDPAFTQLASKADLWIPIRPGTDTALLMALCELVFENDDLNTDYLSAHTVAPFLVRSDTGKYLRNSEVDASVAAAKAAQEQAAKAAYDQALQGAIAQGTPPALAAMAAAAVQKQMAFDDQPMVLQNGKLTPANQATSPDLFATYDADGVSCTTALNILKDSVSTMPPSRAAEIAQVPEDTIQQLYQIVTDQPVTHTVGWGPQAYMNGEMTFVGGYTLCALLGNIGYPGAAWGGHWMMFQGFNSMYLMGAGVSSAKAVNVLDFPDVCESQQFQGQPYPMKMLTIANGNPFSTQPGTNSWKEKVLPNLDHIITFDNAMTDSAAYSDLILPVAQWFEHPDVIFTGQVQVLSYSEKAIDPLYESKTDLEIIHLIADQFGMGDYFSSDYDEVCAQLLDSDAAKAAGITLDKLKSELELRYTTDEPHIGFAGGKFTTPTGRLEFYCEDPQPRVATNKTPTAEDIERERVLNFFPPAQAWPDGDAMKKYPIVLNSERPRYRVHSQWYSTPMLREIDSEPTVKMNPADAQARGLSDGDYVECYNDYGHAVAKLVCSDAVRPGMASYEKSWQASQHKAGSWSELISDDYNVFTVNSNFMDVVCEVRAWEGEE